MLYSTKPKKKHSLRHFLPAMFCGSGSFSHMDDFSGEIAGSGADHSAPSTPKGSRRKRENKNPYATRGLDKFSTVLAELEARREKILSKANANGASMVRFMYSNSDDWIPVVVRIPDPEEKDSVDKKKNKKKLKDNEVTAMPSTAKSETSSPPPSSPKVSTDLMEEKTKIVEKKIKKKSFPWPTANLKTPCYLPAVMILILFCLVVFGRVFAICCTSVWWYLVPTMQEYFHCRNSRRSSTKKKDYKRKPSDKKLVVVGNAKMRA